jgi:hypothetical protein
MPRRVGSASAENVRLSESVATAYLTVVLIYRPVKYEFVLDENDDRVPVNI